MTPGPWTFKNKPRSFLIFIHCFADLKPSGLGPNISVYLSDCIRMFNAVPQYIREPSELRTFGTQIRKGYQYKRKDEALDSSLIVRFRLPLELGGESGRSISVALSLSFSSGIYFCRMRVRIMSIGGQTSPVRSMNRCLSVIQLPSPPMAPLPGFSCHLNSCSETPINVAHA